VFLCTTVQAIGGTRDIIVSNVDISGSPTSVILIPETTDVGVFEVYISHSNRNFLAISSSSGACTLYSIQNKRLPTHRSGRTDISILAIIPTKLVVVYSIEAHICVIDTVTISHETRLVPISNLCFTSMTQTLIKQSSKEKI
jgi:hypothetical protein